MKQLTGNQIRQMFLDYFASKGHMVEPGASLVPHNDPTLLWINAGVAALKKYFDGSEKPKCNRITNAQKSIRTNDIENVGKTARHHTFFEMLGNFSIGDYFKAEAIPYAWEFLTDEKWMGIPKEKLYVSFSIIFSYTFANFFSSELVDTFFTVKYIATPIMIKAITAHIEITIIFFLLSILSHLFLVKLPRGTGQYGNFLQVLKRCYLIF